MGVELIGDERLAAGLQRAASRLGTMPPAAALIAAAAIRARAPKRTGALAASVSGHETAQGIAVRTGVDYAKPVEAKRAYANPGIADSRPGWESVYAAYLQDLLDAI
ncbi:hypothetical protein CGZ94_04935 [Enemella evansiae]|uniref:Uncharacterized protein n=1 Tax=Enemella evansiae TaxID=2016499 RepID=A0A255GKB6_9ACTN|nr:hypothetical protein [Enemella evansiae]OYO16288.1 hypothetical protein CGZ94_04935 [Enemella evansiae]